MMKTKLPLHYLGLLGAIALGAALRFWHLDLKPMWMDEIITALFSLGKTYDAIPLQVISPFSALDQVFTLNPDATCPQITQVVSTQSVHPPLFFCLMHQWLRWVNPTSEDWVWKLRALPALFGVGAIAALYYLNRVAFSNAAGMMGAALMAVSPFAVYLSQEARHYTLPMLLITLALAGLIQMQQDLQPGRSLRWWVWIGWVVINSVGFYVHYFFLLAFAAQVLALLGLTYWQRSLLAPHKWSILSLAMGTVGLSYLLWLPTFLSHMNRPETDWLIPFEPSWEDKVAPLYQIPAGLLITVISLPVENQPIWITIPAAVLMLLFAGWLGWQVSRGLRQVWRTYIYQPATFMLISFLLWVLLEFLAIAYLLGKDITVVFRYNFVYYPAFCALLGASLAHLPRQQSSLKVRWKQPLPTFSPRQVQSIVLLAGLLSCIFVVSNLVFQKPYYPQRVAQDMLAQGIGTQDTGTQGTIAQNDNSQSLLIVGGYDVLFEAALDLSFVLEAEKLHPNSGTPAYYALFKRTSSSYEPVWQNLAQTQQPLKFPLNLWVIGPGLMREGYPPQLQLPNHQAGSKPATCNIAPDQYNRIGVPYQLYRCKA